MKIGVRNCEMARPLWKIMLPNSMIYVSSVEVDEVSQLLLN